MNYIKVPNLLPISNYPIIGSTCILTISGIASEAGFKSKTSFYKFFKKEFKMTPKEYLVQAREG